VSDTAASATNADPTPSALPRTVTPEVLKGAFRRHAAGVAVITADAGEGPLAITVSSLSSVSVDPAVVLCSVASTTATGRAMARAATVVVHLLDGEDLRLAVRCATPGIDRFDEPATWRRLPSGEPTFTAPRVRLRGTVVQRSVFGDSTVLVIAVLEVLARDGRTAVPAGSGPSDDQVDPVPGALAYLDRAWHVLDERSQVD